LEFIAACGDIRVCVIDGSTHQQVLTGVLPGQKLISRSTGAELFESLANGFCNVIAHEGYVLAEPLVRDAGYQGQYLIGQTLFSKEPLAMVTRAEDPWFSDFANPVLNTLIVAEVNGITQSTASLMGMTDAFGTGYSDMFQHAIAAGGNYGELYDRYLERYSKRHTMNLINFGTLSDTGLLYSHPFGSITNQVGKPTATLLEIAKRGTLWCGVRSDRPGFAATNNSTYGTFPVTATMTGMEIDYCRALAASTFAGAADAVEVVDVADQKTAFALLAAGKLDVVVGVTWNLLNDIQVPGFKESFSFTSPYFYGGGDNSGEVDNLCLATRQGDHMWSAFVYWVVEAIVQAEEVGVTQGMSNGMPNVNLFGEEFELMFQGATLSVGNYGEMYDRHLSNRIPRSGRNLLNGNAGPQLYPMPGLLRWMNDDFGCNGCSKHSISEDWAGWQERLD
jgi:ABC-type amino acid transport substrate-binding protein